MDVEDIDETSDEMKDSEAGEPVDDDDDDDANMMGDEDLKQDPPDHIKLVMEVRIFVIFIDL